MKSLSRILLQTSMADVISAAAVVTSQAASALYPEKIQAALQAANHKYK